MPQPQILRHVTVPDIHHENAFHAPTTNIKTCNSPRPLSGVCLPCPNHKY